MEILKFEILPARNCDFRSHWCIFWGKSRLQPAKISNFMIFYSSISVTPGIGNPENIYEIFRKSLCIFIQSWIYSSKEEISFQSLSNNCTKVSLRFNCGKTNFLTRASIGIIHLGPKFRGKRLWSRLDSCDLKDFRSKVKDIFIVKMSLTFQNLSRDIKLESLVPFDYKIRAFLLSRDEFWKV